MCWHALLWGSCLLSHHYPRPSPEPLSLSLGRGQPEDKEAESLPGAEVGARLGIPALTLAFILGSRPLRPALGLSVQGRSWAQALES